MKSSITKSLRSTSRVRENSFYQNGWRLLRGISSSVFFGLLFLSITEAVNVYGQLGSGQIVFQSERDGNIEIYRMNADGSNQTRLTNNTFVDSQPKWSPDGTKIVFVSDRDGNREIYVMDADGSNQIRLTNNTFRDVRPFWSPDGAKILFVSTRSGNDDIYLMNADGSGETRLTTDANIDDFPNWSPNGALIAFTRYNPDGITGNLYSMNADGSNQNPLIGVSGNDQVPAWSPDSSQIVFTSYRSGNYEIHKMNADGTNIVRLTNFPFGENVGPSWSPDGTKILFTREVDYINLNYEIFTMNADGTNEQQLTNVAGIDVGGNWQIVPSFAAPVSAGQNVAVAPSGNLNLTFGNVITPGAVTATILTPNQLPPLPFNFSLIGSPLLYNITTSAVFTGNIVVTFNVPNVASAAACSQLRVLHYVNNNWDLSGNSTPVYNAGSQTCTLSQTVSSLSPFVVAQSNPPANIEQCKNGGWRQFDVPRRFKNQGDCIQFVNTGR